MSADIKDIQKIYSDINKNSLLIKEALLKEELEISKVDIFFRERDNLFKNLKYQYENNSISPNDTAYMKKIIDENRELQELFEDKKRTMSQEILKKEKMAKKISQYKNIK